MNISWSAVTLNCTIRPHHKELDVKIIVITKNLSWTYIYLALWLMARPFFIWYFVISRLAISRFIRKKSPWIKTCNCDGVTFPISFESDCYTAFIFILFSLSLSLVIGTGLLQYICKCAFIKPVCDYRIARLDTSLGADLTHWWVSSWHVTCDIQCYYYQLKYSEGNRCWCSLQYHYVAACYV